MSKSYYAAANTENGFKSLFDNVFSPKELSRIYIIKGGPGTGKSTLMRGIGKTAEKCGLRVEYYYCSADTASLDGVKIPDLGIAMIDGTSPHTQDPRYPGACESIINLGRNFDVQKLKAERTRIEELTDECGTCYRRSVRFLRAAGETERLRLDVVFRAFDEEKARKTARRILSRFKPKGGKYAERYVSAMGTKGAVHITNELEDGEKKVFISGKYGFEKLFIRVFAQEAAEGGYTVLRCPDVLLHDYTEGIYIKEAKTFYVISEESQEEINSMRFACNAALGENRGKLRFADKCREALLQGALSELSKMGRMHDELESIYAEAMDFEANDRIRISLEKEIFG